MAQTNFGALTDHQLKAWSKDFWSVMREHSFMDKFAGGGTNKTIQRVRELSKRKKGKEAVITLLYDLTGDGITGDNTLEGNEEELRADEITIQIDMLRDAVMNHGKLADQNTLISFRERARDQLGYWLGNRLDQIAILTLSGVDYKWHNNGRLRANSSQPGAGLKALAFNADVTAPTANRHFRVAGSGTSSTIERNADTNNLGPTNQLSYRAIVELKNFAKESFIRGLRGGSEEMYHMFVTPTQMKTLKLDPDFIDNTRNAGPRGANNTLWKGTSNSVVIDGVMIHEHRLLFNTATLSDTELDDVGWNTNGARALFCGAQALAYADIDSPEIVEEGRDYKNKQAISIGKMFGFRKPRFHSDHHNSVEDFGVICLDTAVPYLAVDDGAS